MPSTSLRTSAKNTVHTEGTRCARTARRVLLKGTTPCDGREKEEENKSHRECSHRRLAYQMRVTGLTRRARARLA